jgi:hypothetical protein
LETFRSYYSDLRTDVRVEKNDENKTSKQQLQDSSEESDDSEEEQGKSTENLYDNWRRFGFSTPLKMVFQLSAFPMLTCLYKVLATLPVSSCTAERAMSRLKIIKNRLRSTMSDERLDDLMVIASERDILEKIPTDAIIDRFGRSSTQLQKLLLPWCDMTYVVFSVFSTLQGLCRR